MAAHPIKQRLIPHRVLDYLLYADTDATEWLQSVSENKVRVTTGPAARALRLKISQLWRTLEWLRDNQYISFEKEDKRGTALVTLRQPTNIKTKVDYCG